MANNSFSNIVFLHGDLHLRIIEARNLSFINIVTGNILCRVNDLCPENTRLMRPAVRRIVASDPYVKVSVLRGQVALAYTSVSKRAKNPKWNERFIIPLAHEVAQLEFEVRDDDVFNNYHILGTVNIPAGKIVKGDRISGWFPLKNISCKDSALRLEMTFIPCETNQIYKHGIAGDLMFKGVHDTYFPLRKGSQVTLYQDAHVLPESKMPRIELDDGKVYEHNSCWEDICHAISSAQHMIYIVSWSVLHKIKLIREPTQPLPRGGDLTLGELLKLKSEEGVRVLLLLWDDITSYNNIFVKTNGYMKTYDEETRKFFKHSSVQCVLSPRDANSKLHLHEKAVRLALSHHQKCVLLDTQAYGNNRKITAFIGGLDFGHGRYDTPEHRLFHDVHTVFKDDVYQPTFKEGTKAPRQPWHDLHCKIDVPAAYDVLINFEQRWRKCNIPNF